MHTPMYSTLYGDITSDKQKKIYLKNGSPDPSVGYGKHTFGESQRSGLRAHQRGVSGEEARQREERLQP